MALHELAIEGANGEPHRTIPPRASGSIRVHNATKANSGTITKILNTVKSLPAYRRPPRDFFRHEIILPDSNNSNHPGGVQSYLLVIFDRQCDAPRAYQVLTDKQYTVSFDINESWDPQRRIFYHPRPQRTAPPLEERRVAPPLQSSKPPSSPKPPHSPTPFASTFSISRPKEKTASQPVTVPQRITTDKGPPEPNRLLEKPLVLPDGRINMGCLAPSPPDSDYEGGDENGSDDGAELFSALTINTPKKNTVDPPSAKYKANPTYSPNQYTQKNIYSGTIASPPDLKLDTHTSQPIRQGSAVKRSLTLTPKPTTQKHMKDHLNQHPGRACINRLLYQKGLGDLCPLIWSFLVSQQPISLSNNNQCCYLNTALHTLWLLGRIHPELALRLKKVTITGPTSPTKLKPLTKSAASALLCILRLANPEAPSRTYSAEPIRAALHAAYPSEYARGRQSDSMEALLHLLEILARPTLEGGLSLSMKGSV